MTHEQLDKKLIEYSAVSKKIELMTEIQDELRKEIFGYIEDNGLTEGYKNDIATVSYVQRKAVKITDETKLLKDLISQRIVNYYKVVPEHYELSPNFSKDIKAGVFKHELVEVEEKPGLAIKLN